MLSQESPGVILVNWGGDLQKGVTLIHAYPGYGHRDIEMESRVAEGLAGAGALTKSEVGA